MVSPVQNGSSIFPLLPPTQPLAAEFINDAYFQLCQLIALQCVPIIGSSPVTAGATLTAPANNATILLNTAAGSVVTLPAATGSGVNYRFRTTTTTTSGAHKILAASSSDFLQGIVIGETGGTCKSFASGNATNHSLQMPFSGSQPSGGFIGDYFDVQDIAPNLWQVNGMYQAGTTPTTPFSTATS